MNTSYIESKLSQPPINAPTVAIIKRPSGICITSAMLGAMEADPKPLCTLSNLLDVALATLFVDGSVSVSFPTIKE